MSLSPGQPAPPISGVNIINNQPWSLQAQAGKHVMLVFSGITWCGPCKAEAPHLDPVWQQLKGNWNPPFHMALISGKFGVEEDPQELQSAIAQYGITFPVIPGDSFWPVYEITGVPTIYCLLWDEQANQHKIGDYHVGATDEQGLLDFLAGCGIAPYTLAPWKHWVATFLILFGGVATDGGGWGITPGGKPIPIPPWDPLRNLGPAGRDALTGLAMAEMAAQLEDPALRDRARRAGLETTRASIERLASTPGRAPLGIDEGPRTWGVEQARKHKSTVSRAEAGDT